MNLDLAAVALLFLSIALLGPASRHLSRSTWVFRAPRASVLLWLSIGLSAMTAAIGAGLCVAVERFNVGFVGGVERLISSVFGGHPLAGLGLPDALGLTLAVDLGVVVLAVIGTLLVRTIGARARHRRLLNLLADVNPQLPDTDILEHPSAVAYCLPGIRPRIVISSGTLELLSSPELAAVLDHERGHARERHGLVMIPMTGLTNIMGWIPYARLAPAAVAELLEMAADDYSIRLHGVEPLAKSLVKLASSGRLPTCTLAFAAQDVSARMLRLLDVDRSSRRSAFTALALGVVLLAAPAAIIGVA
jgi:Zn-dependent protease with chaperone function